MEVSSFQYDILLLKMYNDYFWVKYSEYTLPALLLLYIYKYFKPVDNTKVKVYTQIKRQWHDKASVPFIFYAPIYYLIDGMCLVLSGLAFEQQCKTDMLIHHIVSSLFLPLIVFSRHIPSWLLGPGVFHGLLLTFPTFTWLKYPYLFIMIIFNLKLFSQPYTRFLPYKFLKYGVVILYASLMMIHFHSCSNSIEDFPSKVTSIYPTPGYSPLFKYVDIRNKINQV